MEITGKIIAVLPERGGVSARSGAEWRCASYVIETIEQYPRKMNFEVFGTDRIQQFNIQAGETLTVSFDIDAREYHRQDGTVSWINSIRAWKVDRNLQPTEGPAPMPNMQPFAPAAAPQAAPMPTTPPADMTAGAPFAASDSADDLPF